MRDFWKIICVTALVWLPSGLAVLGAAADWNFYIVFMLMLSGIGFIATLAAFLVEVPDAS